MKHILSLEVPDTANSKIFRVVDTSSYAAELPVAYPLLTITPPGFVTPVHVQTTERFGLVLNACTLGIQTIDCGEELVALPDGLYHIRYSVSPNDQVWVEYKHLRMTCTLNSYYDALAGIEGHGCNMDECTLQQLKELRLIKSFLDVAKAKVEYSHKCEEGLEMLAFAKKKLRAFSGWCCK